MDAMSPLETTNKVKARIPRLVQAARNGENMDKVAEELGMTRRGLSYNMQTPEYKELFNRVLMEDFAQHRKDTERLMDDKDPAIMLEAYKERGKMVRAMMPKNIHQQSENYNFDMKLERIEARDFLESLTPEQQDEVRAKLEERQRRRVEEARPVDSEQYIPPEKEGVDSGYPLDETGVDQPAGEAEIESGGEDGVQGDDGSEDDSPEDSPDS